MGGFSIWHLLLVLVVAMLLFGAGRVSEMGKGLGEGIRNFKKGLKDDEEDPPEELPLGGGVVAPPPPPPPPQAASVKAVSNANEGMIALL